MSIKSFIYFIFIVSPFINYGQLNFSGINYELNLIPFQQAIISNDQFTPILNSEYSSFDFNISRNQFRFLASKRIKNKWKGGIGIGFVQTKANWVVGFDRDNSSFFNTVNTYSNQVTFNFDIHISYQLLKKTTVNLFISPHFEIHSKSNHIELSNRGSFNSSSGFRADYTEWKGGYSSLLTYDLHLKTYISKSFFIIYGANLTKYGNPKSNKVLYYYEMEGEKPLFEEGETIVLIKIGGYIPFGYIGFGYKFNNK